MNNKKMLHLEFMFEMNRVSISSDDEKNQEIKTRFVSLVQENPTMNLQELIIKLNEK